VSPRLKDVVNQLHRPLLHNGRQVFALPRKDAEQLPRLPSVAVISITSPNTPPAALDGFEHLLRLEFEDLDFLNNELSTKAQAKLPGAFTENQAQSIRSFVEGLPESIHTIIVHCQGGFSRSCAVAHCLHHLYGYRVEEERLEKANPSVIQVLMSSSIEHPVKKSHQRKSGRP
jgi:predicted protein tyrosine phosphatase